MMDKVALWKGIAMHCYHNELFSWVWDVSERRTYILKNKRWQERTLRDRLLQIIPRYRLSAELLITCDEAEQLILAEQFILVPQLWEKAISTHMAELLTLHKELCPDCPWDGMTIFTRQNEHDEWY